VDAIDPAAAAFYRRHGFTSIPKNPLRLLGLMMDIPATLTKPSAGAPGIGA